MCVITLAVLSTNRRPVADPLPTRHESCASTDVVSPQRLVCQTTLQLMIQQYDVEGDKNDGLDGKMFKNTTLWRNGSTPANLDSIPSDFNLGLTRQMVTCV
ncbi:hypothetical protein DYB37_008765 [Aphanomyces astaci]|uniref:Uncharacterized protein n=1 Tax=Aphanomyces astaci TaxID=112090 RepID=A0A3R7B1X9_APHAT|nr:hypothetical protein DYB35_007330 [Aphanomyces astaci]RHZ15731.1 hypothetical protein DYB37_008765 [Aphanomyces astaci]